MDKKQIYMYCTFPCCRYTTVNTSGKPFFRVPKHAVKELYDKIKQLHDKNGNGIQ